ncbi:hypothetical protein [Bacillus bombysepticus]|uniref:hypothetical protein n=1 Tax=Bacillus bombysepticus TaxID=658666 RepID=UPI003016ACD8
MLFYEVITGTELEKTLLQKEQFKKEFNKLSDEFYKAHGVRPAFANPENLIVYTEHVLELAPEIQEQFHTQSQLSGAKQNSILSLQWEKHCSHSNSGIENIDDSIYRRLKLLPIMIQKLDHIFYIISYEAEELNFMGLVKLETLDRNFLSRLRTAIMKSNTGKPLAQTSIDTNNRTFHL